MICGSRSPNKHQVQLAGSRAAIGRRMTWTNGRCACVFLVNVFTIKESLKEDASNYYVQKTNL